MEPLRSNPLGVARQQAPGPLVATQRAGSIEQGPREAIACQLFKRWVVVHFTFVLAAWIASLRKGGSAFMVLMDMVALR